LTGFSDFADLPEPERVLPFFALEGFAVFLLIFAMCVESFLLVGLALVLADFIFWFAHVLSSFLNPGKKRTPTV